MVDLNGMTLWDAREELKTKKEHILKEIREINKLKTNNIKDIEYEIFKLNIDKDVTSKIVPNYNTIIKKLELYNNELIHLKTIENEANNRYIKIRKLDGEIDDITRCM